MKKRAISEKEIAARLQKYINDMLAKEEEEALRTEDPPVQVELDAITAEMLGIALDEEDV